MKKIPFLIILVGLFFVFGVYKNANAETYNGTRINYTGSMTRGGVTYTDYFIAHYPNGYIGILYNLADFPSTNEQTTSNFDVPYSSYYLLNCDENLTDCGYETQLSSSEIVGPFTNNTLTNGLWYLNSTYDSYGSSTTIYHTGSSDPIMFAIGGGIGTIGITTISPENDATNVNAYTTFTGTYDNDGTYDTVIIGYSNLDDITPTLHLNVCAIANVGTDLNYTCNISLSTNAHYQYTPTLWDSHQEFPDGIVTDTGAPYHFQTGETFVTVPTLNGNDCTGIDIGCYLQEALQYLFIPSQTSLNQFADLKNIFITKAPFGYVVAINNELTNLNDEGTDAFTLQSLPILNTYIFDPIRSALIWILWVGFAFVLFHRLKNIHL